MSSMKMGTRMKTITSALGLALVLLVGVGRMSAQSGYDLFQQALTAERADGNLAGALTLYQRVVSEFAGDRALVARALVRLGDGYEKLGDPQARAAFERVVREFADQVESAAQARTRLAVLTRHDDPTSASGVVVRQVWTGPGVDLLGGLSADGRYLSHVDWETGDLAIRDLVSGEKRRLTSAPPGEFAFYSKISRDGRNVAYVWTDKEHPYHLRMTSVDDLRRGGTPRVLVRDTPGYMEVGDWSPDGKTVLANIRGIDLISVADGAMTTLKTLNWGARPKPRFSPDGRWIVYNVQSSPSSPDRDIVVIATDGSRETPLVEHAGDDFVLGWAPDGKRILFASNRTGAMSAWVIAVENGAPQGAPELVKADIGHVAPLGFARTGAFYYGLSTGLPDVYTATLDPETGRVVVPPVPISQQLQGRASSPAWSPDGQFLAYLSNRRGPINSARGARVIAIRSLSTGQERELSAPLSFEVGAPPTRLQWSPDGRFLLATGSDSRGRGGLYRIDVLSGDVLPIVQDPSAGFRPQGVWSSDGKAVFYSRDGGLWSRDLDTNQEAEIYRQPAEESGGSGRNLALSPDGRWLAFGDRRVLMVVASSGGEPRELMQLEAEEKGSFSGLEWAADGRHLLFSIGDSTTTTPELWRISVAGGKPEKTGLATQSWATLAVHPDGRQIAFSAGEPKQEVWVMENFWPVSTASR